MARNTDRGAAAVEFALVMIPLVLLLLALVDFGRAFYIQSTIAGAAREGVRTLALGGDKAAADAMISGFAGPGVMAGSTVTYQIDGVITGSPVCASNKLAAVSVAYPYDFITGLDTWAGISFTLNGRGTMRCGG